MRMRQRNQDSHAGRVKHKEIRCDGDEIRARSEMREADANTDHDMENAVQ